ncbi:tRNA (adenosine(37)-N6)-dimethylallyltransferase MiaA [Paenibacillus turpanensis]|uniref:tRNA (adenosine(37)-N6)-dimethylallyltransferase MiaA n=1 Tax=Paenibacillus turpanensis TaxID=2689078 RepID=UPI0014085DA3|nr:tRNA (adenosine(37)-N6)-dimethylallyltransferase MiaA [Paenibacillus turpanensis]
MLSSPDPNKPNLLVLVGPTAVGKTALSISLAKQWNAEIISGDSMQVYRGMDIGTAKISPQEMQGVPHHLIDIHSPDEPYSAAEFQSGAEQLIADITARGKLPFIVGGTGLYIESVCYGYQFTDVQQDETYRAEMNDLADAFGTERLHELLLEADPNAAGRIHPNDRKRLIRALEVIRQTGKPLSKQDEKKNKESPYNLCLLCLTMDRAQLYARIETRIDQMVQLGLLEEVRNLLQSGYSSELPSMQGLGYKEIAAYLEGNVTLPDAVALLKRNTRRFAKRQLSWFRHMGDMHWIDVTPPSSEEERLDQINTIIRQTLGG